MGCRTSKYAPEPADPPQPCSPATLTSEKGLTPTPPEPLVLPSPSADTPTAGSGSRTARSSSLYITPAAVRELATSATPGATETGDVVVLGFALWAAHKLLPAPADDHYRFTTAAHVAHSFITRALDLAATVERLSLSLCHKLRRRARDRFDDALVCIRPPSPAVVAESLLAELGRLVVSYFLIVPWTDPQVLYTINRKPPNCLTRVHVMGRSSQSTLSEMDPSPRARWQRAIEQVRSQLAVRKLCLKRELTTLIRTLRAVGNDEVCVRPHRRGSGTRRRPTLLMLGGGMGAGKSTVVSLLKNDPRYDQILKQAVIVEADAFKIADPAFAIRQQLSSKHLDADIHRHSVQAAENLLLAAISRQRDIVFDGTMSWAPFVEQTVAMVRDLHEVYEKGPGYVVHDDGTVTEQYWKPLLDPARREEFLKTCPIAPEHRAPYVIEMIGVTCAPEVAVTRGFSRYIVTERPVPLAGQIRSHRQFSAAFHRYLPLFDAAVLFDTTCADTAPVVVARKEAGGEVEVCHADLMGAFEAVQLVQETATSADELYPPDAAGSHLRWHVHLQGFENQSSIVRLWMAV